MSLFHLFFPPLCVVSSPSLSLMRPLPVFSSPVYSSLPSRSTAIPFLLFAGVRLSLPIFSEKMLLLVTPHFQLSCVGDDSSSRSGHFRFSPLSVSNLLFLVPSSLSLLFCNLGPFSLPPPSPRGPNNAVSFFSGSTAMSSALLCCHRFLFLKIYVSFFSLFPPPAGSDFLSDLRFF